MILLEEIMNRCDAIADTKLETSKIPAKLFPKNYELTVGVKLIMINSFLTVLCNYGDLNEQEFNILLIRYRMKLDPDFAKSMQKGG